MKPIKSKQYKKFIDKLDPVTGKIINDKIGRFAKGLGVMCKPIRTCNDGSISQRLYEVIIDYGPGYRVYCTKSNGLVNCLYGGTKKSQKSDILSVKKLFV